MLDQNSEVGSLAVWLVNIADDRLDSLRCRTKCIDARLQKTYFVIIDTSDKPIQCAGYRNTAFDVRHIRTTVQGMTDAVQLVRNVKRRTMPFARLDVVANDLEMTRGLF